MKLIKALVIVSMLFSLVPALSSVSLAAVQELGGAIEYNKIGLACDKSHKVVATSETSSNTSIEAAKAVRVR